MIADTPETRGEIQRIRGLVTRLMLVSHAPSQAFNPAPPTERMPQRWRTRDTPHVPHASARHRHGGDTKKPTGNIDRKGDLTPEYRQKSHLYFAWTLRRWERSHHFYGISDLRRLRIEAEQALDWWKRTPSVPGVQHDRDSFLWKCEVADAPGTVDEVCRKYGVSRATLYRYRARYGNIRSKAA